VKWYLPAADEPFSAKATQILRDFEAQRIQLLTPDFFWPEFGNVLWKAVRQGRMAGETASRAIELVGGLEIVTFPSQPLIGEAFAIATAHLRTVYDSVYVALAMTTHTPLITADERLVNSLGSRFPVRWLGAL
jgi:predicted nucleic acid-binding protein